MQFKKEKKKKKERKREKRYFALPDDRYKFEVLN